MLRNQLCSCGSGKRYKHCHGLHVVQPATASPATDPAASAPRDPADTLNRALAAQRNGELQLAETLYEAALQMLPGHFDALHMLGVVKLQLGSFADARRVLVEALPRVPENMLTQFKHNLALCLTGVARERGLLLSLTRPLPEREAPAPFVHAFRNAETPAIEPDDISVIVTNAESIADLEQTLDSIRAAIPRPVEVVVPVAADSTNDARIEAALAARGFRGRIERSVEAGAAQCINAAAEVASGEFLALVRAGDRWTRDWPAHMIAAMRDRQAMWGFSGMRVVNAEGGIVVFGRTPDTSQLLRAQDEMYVHETPSLALLGFNPVASGRNLLVRSDWWRARGGLVIGSGDPFLDWAWNAAQQHEPLYLDEPDYLIHEGTAGLHLHASAAELLAETARFVSASEGRLQPAAGADNPYLRNGIARFWARQWEQIFALEVTVPLLVLNHCANMLESQKRLLDSPAVA